MRKNVISCILHLFMVSVASMADGLKNKAGVETEDIIRIQGIARRPFK